MTFVANIVGWTRVATAGMDSISSIYNSFREMRANPGKARSEALKKCREDCQAAFDKSVAEMDTLRKSFEESSKKSEESADRRFREQQELNNSVIEKIQKRLEESDLKYDEEQKKMISDHQKQMAELRSESKEERAKVEKEHKEKMEKLEKKHDAEKKETNAKLEETKKDGALRISKASEEKEAVIAERKECLDNYHSEMKKLLDKNHEKLMELNKEAVALKSENSRLRVENLKKENETTLQQIEERTNELLKHFHREHSREVIQTFRGIMEKVEESRNSLSYLAVECGKPELVEPGAMDPDLRSINNGRTLYQDRVRRYRQFAINATHANPMILKACAEFITNTTQVMEDQTLLQITTHLPKAIENGDSEAVRAYGEMAEQMCAKIEALNIRVQGKLDELTANNFQEAIEDGK